MNDFDTFQKNCSEFVQRYANLVQKIVTDPSVFFQNQLGHTDIAEPTIFAGINIILPKLIYALLFAPLTMGFSFLAFSLSIFFSVSLFLGTCGVLFLITQILGRKESFWITYRYTAYASVAFLAWLIPIPFANLVIFSTLFCILLYFAIVEAHQFTETFSIVFLFILNFLIVFVGVIINLMTMWLLFRVILLFVRSVS